MSEKQIAAAKVDKETLRVVDAFCVRRGFTRSALINKILGQWAAHEQEGKMLRNAPNKHAA